MTNDEIQNSNSPTQSDEIEPAPTLAAPRENGNTRNRAGQFAKGTSGNPAGRPRGSRNRMTELLENMLEAEGEGLAHKVIECALGGNIQALRLCLTRLLPPRRDRTIQLPLPPIQSASQIAEAMSTIFEAIGDGLITPSEGESLTNILTKQINVLAITDLSREMAGLEQRISHDQNKLGD
jgi:hypothetical protein